jgi:hypothetical protein
MAKKSRSKKEPVLLRRLRDHFGGDPADLPVIEQNFAAYERPQRESVTLLKCDAPNVSRVESLTLDSE